ncbi:hypothetical protein M426DRAFT_23579 [Hypoxylon sp. CI-4A]|nr:hypothetical protein M426DRAFT_23579 [Hypoxylon sp. CI-4A]
MDGSWDGVAQQEIRRKAPHTGALDCGNPPTRTPNVLVPTAKIQSPKIKDYQLPSQSFFSVLLSQEDLNSYEAISSSSQSSLSNNIISPRDFSVFTTDSQQSTWLPSSSSSQPAQPAQPSFPPPQQDFVLFDQPPPPQRQNVNRAVSSPAPQAAPFGSLNSNHHHSPHVANASASPSLQNQRVAQIIRATGHPTSPSTAFTNRYNSPGQLYASISAIQSPTGVNQQNRSARPPVPLFAQGVNQQSSNKMDLQGNLPGSDTAGFLISHNTDAVNFDDLAHFSGGPTTAYSSPGVPNLDMNMSSTPSSASNMTVSPQELWLDPATSAPNSTAFTNLTSPSMHDGSPDLFDNFEVSPCVGANDFDTHEWPSLFPEQASTTSAAAMEDLSPDLQSEELDLSELTSKPRRKSGNSSPGGGHGRHSSVAGVNSRRRDKPLPPIVVDDPTDPVAMKRARNTLAARKSRERKAVRFDELEAKIDKLTEERDYWKSKFEALQRHG